MAHSPVLIETLRDAQRLGFFGAGSIEDAVAHATHFVDALVTVPTGASVIDLGSGGGLPGLVVAEARPDLHVVLLDRRQKRTDFLERAVRRLGYDHAEVWSSDADDVVHEVAEGRRSAFDAATARGFGPPESTLRTAVGLVRAGGLVVISEPPSGDRWSRALLTELDLTIAARGTVVQFRLASI